MMVKSNPYSEKLRAALNTIAEIGSPDFTLMPIDPSITMLEHASHSTGLPIEIVRQSYYAMINAWLEETENR